MPTPLHHYQFYQLYHILYTLSLQSRKDRLKFLQTLEDEISSYL